MAIGIFLILATLAVAAATLAIVNIRLKGTTTTATTTTITTTTTTTITATTSKQSLGSEYAEAIQISDVMKHLNELQRIATAQNNTRAINTPGFNQTLDYIYNSLSSSTNFKVVTSYFNLRNFIIAGNPTLITSINGVTNNRTFSYDLAIAEFFFAQYTRSANFPTDVPISVIPNVGCEEADWLAVNPSPSGRVALVKRGDCTFVEKAALASKYNVAALLIYNDGTLPDRISPIYISLGATNELPALFLSYTLGQELADAAQNSSNNVGVRIIISLADESTFPVGNICADTPTGDVTQTIVIGSHSDSVPAGPGINDNGQL
jgi:Zn-dependent M28 family amino/carboxypeptidase